MRTQGTLQDVYKAAKAFYNMEYNNSTYGGCPMDPVIRHTTDGVWMLESGINGEPNADGECRLDDFDTYFYEGYGDDDYMPTDDDEAEFLKVIIEDVPDRYRFDDAYGREE